MKPLIKWAGGKRHIAEDLFKLFPSDWDSGTYFEPFIGGAAIFLHLEPKRAVIADVNQRLIGFYEHIKRSPIEMFEGIKSLANEFDGLKTVNTEAEEAVINELRKSKFLEFRTTYNASEPDSIQSAILLFALNKLCFNGLYRENSNGFFNVPFGQKKSFPSFFQDDFMVVSELLSETKILNSDFESAIQSAVSGDFIYLDPPYVPIDATSSFTSYHSDGFGLEDQARIARIMLDNKEKGIRMMCSNSDTPVSREIFSDLKIQEILAPRMVSASSAGRGNISELVIMNY